jgi:type VI secretion system protein ImpG
VAEGDTAFSGYQLLLEYFTFRDKFMFVHLNGLDGITPPAGAEYFDIEVVFSTPWRLICRSPMMRFVCTACR